MLRETPHLFNTTRGLKGTLVLTVRFGCSQSSVKEDVVVKIDFGL